MADRTVTVHLNAAVARYLRNMKASEEQTRRVREELAGIREEARHLTFGGIATGLMGLPGLLSPIGAALAALPGLGFGAASAFGAVAVAAHGMGDGFKAVNEADPEKLAEAMAKLSTEGRRFVLEYQRVKPTLDFFADGMQDAMFFQLRGDLEKLVTTYLPTMLNQLPKLSAQMGKMASAEIGLLSSPHIVAQVNSQIALATELTQHWSRMLRAGTEIFFDLADAATAFNRGFVKGMADGTEALRDWIREQVSLGRMNQMLENGAQILSELADLAKVAGELLFDFMANPALADASGAFLDTLRVTLEVVQGFVNAFELLPGPIQTVIASLFAVGGAVMLLSSRFLLLKGAAMAATQHLSTMGPLGISLSRGLERAGRVARTAGIAFAALQIAGAVGSIMRASAPGVDALSEALTRFAVAGEKTSAFTKQFGGDLETLRKDVARAQMRGMEDLRKGAAFESGLMAGLPSVFTDRSNELVLERLTGTDQALAQMVRSGNAAAATKALLEIGVSAEAAAVAFPAYTAALEGTSSAQKSVTVDAMAMARAHENAAMNAAILTEGLRGAVREAGSLRDAFDRLNGAEIEFAELEIDFRNALDRLAEGLKETDKQLRRNGEAMNINTKVGRENHQNLIDGVKASIDAAQAKYDQTVATQGETAALQQANAVYNQHIAELRAAMLATGMNAAKVSELLSLYGSMPPLVATTVTTPGLETAIARAQRLLQLANQLGSKHAAVQFSSGEYSSGRRWGGVTVHAQDGMLRNAGIYSPRSPARYAFSEPATGGEAFVPKNGDYGRSMSILSQAAGWYGASVMPGGGVSQTVVHEHRHTIVIEGTGLLSSLRREVDLTGGKTDNLLGRKRA